ncbi:MAG: hypothetical protein CME33_25520 [Gimesia sp.]|uniref:hypothetical protein n=1 Tax=Gimesia sp. TaxID=2024833 RepID=UPI000C3730C1|nr:hypothetical protein [Gimesia sp.]MAX39917.1 hypothetical protein [Gimesia sp.]|tara:strand:- start:4754 stop:5707 length:954 start_codon:yes stop_codon:yes gene_type:complete
MAKRSSSYPWFYIVLFLVVAVGISIIFFLYNGYLNNNWDQIQDFGTRGDAFGGLNTLFAGIGVAGVVVAIFMQSAELRNQREELRDNTNSLLLSSYLNGLESLRQFYLEEMKHENMHDDAPKPELSPTLKYQLTLDKMEALIRHIEDNESELEHLEGADSRRCEHWLDTLERSIQIFTNEWARIMARRSSICRHHSNGIVEEHVGNVEGTDLMNTAIDFANHFLELIQQLTKSEIKEKGDALHDELLDFIAEIETAIENNKEEKKNAGQDKWISKLTEDIQDQLELSSVRLKSDTQEYLAFTKNRIIEGSRLNFIKP